MATNIISSGLDTASTIYNSNGGILISGDAVKGGYFVTDTLDNIPSWTKVPGTLCYCTADSKFYQYNGSTWEEATFGTSFEELTASEVEGAFEAAYDGAYPENEPEEAVS